MKRALTIIASVLVIVTIVVVASIFMRVWRIPYSQFEVFGISHSIVHWIGWTGALFIAFVTPIYPTVKRKYPKYTQKTLSVHVTGNLLGVLLVSIHFAHQVTRPASSYPDLGTGIILYTTMILLLATGVFLVSDIGQKFSKQVRFIHPAYALTFYTVIVMHILEDIVLPGIFT